MNNNKKYSEKDRSLEEYRISRDMQKFRIVHKILTLSHQVGFIGLLTSAFCGILLIISLYYKPPLMMIIIFAFFVYFPLILLFLFLHSFGKIGSKELSKFWKDIRTLDNILMKEE